MSNHRKYNCSDIDMLTASKTIAENFSAGISELSAVRSDWTPEYAAGLKTRIDDAVNKYLGADPKKTLRDATSVLIGIQDPARRDLSFFKTQVDDDFRDETAFRNEILTNLGFTKNLRGVQKQNQQSMVQLLYAFKNNMNDTLKQRITGKGMSAELIDRIVAYADAFNEANVSQETFKESTREVTGEAVTAFNDIYNEIIGLCKKVSVYYQFDPLKKEQFTFAKIVANLGSAKKAASKAGPGA